jgi:hypothetical protein
MKLAARSLLSSIWTLPAGLAKLSAMNSRAFPLSSRAGAAARSAVPEQLD